MPGRTWPGVVGSCRGKQFAEPGAQGVPVAVMNIPIGAKLSVCPDDTRLSPNRLKSAASRYWAYDTMFLIVSVSLAFSVVVLTTCHCLMSSCGFGSLFSTSQKP